MSDMFRNHANVFVHADAPQYAALDEWRRSGRADPRDWHDDDRGRAGIWVALSIVQRLAAGGLGARGNATEAEQRAIAGQREAEAAKETS